MLVNKLGVDVLLLMFCRLCFCKSFQSDNYVYYDLNNSALDVVVYRRGSRPVYQVCTNLSDFLGIGSTLNNSHNIFILNLNQFYCLSLFQ